MAVQRWTSAGHSSQLARVIATHCMNHNMISCAQCIRTLVVCSVVLLCWHTGGKDYQAELEQDGSLASFSVELELGEDQLLAAFYGRGGVVVAPYYIYIMKEADEAANGGCKPL